MSKETKDPLLDRRKYTDLKQQTSAGDVQKALHSSFADTLRDRFHPTEGKTL